MNETKCDVIFVNSVGANESVYYSGQKITGSVVISIYDKLEIKEITIDFIGVGRSEWREQRRLYGAEEIYLEKRIQLVRSPNNDKGLCIVPGIYTYHFECDLPKELPTSCEEKFGFIRYVASVHILHASLDEKVHTVPFTVIKPFNLNTEPIFQFPASKQRSIKTIQFLSLKLDQLTVTATLPTNAYAPGQAISVHLIVNNQTDRNINEFNIDLVKIVQYFDAIQKNQKKIKKLLVSTLIDGCGAKSTADFSSEIIVPPVPSTDITSSNVLHVSYELKIYGRFPKNNLKQLVKLPITIGTVPLYSTYRCVHFEDSTENNHIEPLKYEATLNDVNEFVKFSPVYPVYRIRTRKKSRTNSEATI